MLTLTQDIAASDNQTSRNQDTTRSQNATHEGGTRGGAENQQQQQHSGLLKINLKIIKPQYKQYPQEKKPFVWDAYRVRGGVG